MMQPSLLMENWLINFELVYTVRYNILGETKKQPARFN